MDKDRQLEIAKECGFESVMPHDTVLLCNALAFRLFADKLEAEVIAGLEPSGWMHTKIEGAYIPMRCGYRPKNAVQLYRLPDEVK